MIISKDRRAHRTPPIQQTRGRGARATPKNDGPSGCPTKKTAPQRCRRERAASHIRAEHFAGVLGHRCLALTTKQTGKRASKAKNESMQPCRQARQKKTLGERKKVVRRKICRRAPGHLPARYRAGRLSPSTTSRWPGIGGVGRGAPSALPPPWPPGPGPTHR